MGSANSYVLQINNEELIKVASDNLIEKGYLEIKAITRSSLIAHSGKFFREETFYWVKVYDFLDRCLIERFSGRFKDHLELYSKLEIAQDQERDNVLSDLKRINKIISVELRAVMEDMMKRIALLRGCSSIIPIEYRHYTDRFYTIVMKFIDFPSLHQMLEIPEHINGFQSDEFIYSVLFDLLKTLIFIHNQEICHQNLTSKNIFIDNVSKQIVISPIGLFMKSTSLKSKLPQFINHPDEKYQEYNYENDVKYQYDYKCDVFSFGVIVGDILMGSSGNTSRDIHGDDRYQFIKELLDKRGKEKYINFLYDCVNQDRDRRKSFTELLDMLENIHKGNINQTSSSHTGIRDTKESIKPQTITTSSIEQERKNYKNEHAFNNCVINGNINYNINYNYHISDTVNNNGHRNTNNSLNLKGHEDNNMDVGSNVNNNDLNSLLIRFGEKYQNHKSLYERIDRVVKSHLRSLDFINEPVNSFYPITRGLFEDLSVLMGHMKWLEVVDLKDCHLEPNNLCILSKSLPQLSLLEELSYDGNQINDCVVDSLNQNIEIGSSLKTLNLGNELNSTLHSIKDIGIMKLSEVVQKCIQLNSLVISGHQFTGALFLKFVQNTSNLSKLTYFDIGNNPNVGDEFIYCLFSIATQMSLQQIKLDGTSITSHSITFIKENHEYFGNLICVSATKNKATLEYTQPKEYFYINKRQCAINYSD